MLGKRKAPGDRTPVADRAHREQQQQHKQKQQAQQDLESSQNAVDALDDAEVLDDEAGGTRIGDIYIPPPIPAHCSQESKGPRMIIKNIVNRNFKSYAGEVILGPFHHSFTAIIGPNGSGKSNVIDSMLFVFGYRANKIRCKKLSTLIHNSAKYPNLQFCSVAVHFEQIVDIQNSEHCEILPNSKIIVERTAHRDNSAYYTIDGRRVQFKEVSKLLKGYNVDLDHNRFLILQGEVESIAMMKPKGQNENECGMLEYLEDIIGTTRYKKPLELINQRVEQLTEERTEKHNRVKLAEREMKDLEKPFNEAVEYLRQENEYTRTKNIRIQKYLSEKNKKLEKYTKEHEEASDVLKKHDEEAVQLKKEREEKEDLIRKEIQEFEALKKKKEDIIKNLEKTKNKHTEVLKTMDVTNDRRKKNKKQIEQNNAKIETLHKVPEKNRHEIVDCEARIERLNKDKTKFEEQLQANYAEVDKQCGPLIEQRKKLENDLLNINTDEAKSELAMLESQFKMLKTDETSETRKFESLKAAYEESQQSQKEKQSQLQEINNKIPDMHKEIKNKTNELNNMKQEEDTLTAKLLKIRSEINERTMNMQSQRFENSTLEFLMRKKNEGKVPGVFGRLGNLGAIDARYDVAISTACGRLDNIVVDTADTATTCINLLKEFNAGRANFIPLDTISYMSNKMHPINTPENVPRLFDLVRVEDERIKLAFYFALSNTLVSNDLEQGTRIAFGATRYRVVTLKGELIEQSGTMSGGGGRPRSGQMGTKVQTKTSHQSADNSQMSQKALEEMQVQAEELQSRVNYCQEQQGYLEREIEQLKKQLQKYESDIKFLNIALKSLEQQLPSSFKQLEAQRTRMQKKTTDPIKVKEMEQKIEAAKELYDKEQAAADELSKQIKKIESQIDEIHGDKVKSVQKKIRDMTNQITKLNNNVSKLNVEISTSERDIKKIEGQIKNLTCEIETAQDELKALNEEHLELLRNQEKFEEEVEEAQQAINNAKSQSSDVQKEVLKLQKLESDNKLQRIELEQKLQVVASKLKEVKQQIPQFHAQLKPLKLNTIPGDTEPLQPLKTYTEEELISYTLQDVQYKETLLEEQLSKKPNLSCIDEFVSKRDVYLERVKVFEDITSKRNEMRDKYEEVRKRRYTEFMDGFRVITRKLKEMYQMITQGGDAELELVDSMDPFNEGVSFSVRPPKKSWKNISNLSGGEKTLSSLALVFALHYYKPSPLYFMDEIDAALDFKNVSIVGHYIKERTKNAQFIIVSLRSNMFELCNYLVGIYKAFDCTNTVCIRNNPPMLASLATQATAHTDQHFNHSILLQTPQVQNTQQTVPEIMVTEGNEENALPPSQPPPISTQAVDLNLTQAMPLSQTTNDNLMTTNIHESIFQPPSESTGLSSLNHSDNTSINPDDTFKRPKTPSNNNPFTTSINQGSGHFMA